MVLATHDVAAKRAARWMNKHGLAGLTPTPLVVTRLAAYRRMQLITIGWALPVAVVFAAVMVVRDTSRPVLEDPVTLVGYPALIVLGLLAFWVRLRAVRRADRRIGRTLSLRVAHPVPPGLRAILGGIGVATMVLVHGLAIAVGLLAAVFGRAEQTRLLGLALGLGVAVLTGMAWVLALDAARRPALADDAVSLAVDDVLRVMDVRVAVGSFFSPFLAGVLARGEESVWSSVLLVYMVVAYTLLLILLLQPLQRFEAT